MLALNFLICFVIRNLTCNRLKRKGGSFKNLIQKIKKRGQEVNDASFSSWGRYGKIKFTHFRLLLSPIADSHRILWKTHNNTHTHTHTHTHSLTHTPGLRLLIYERRGPRRYLQTLNQKPSSTRGSQWLLEIESNGESTECKLQKCWESVNVCVCVRVCPCVYSMLDSQSESIKPLVQTK